MGINVLDAKNKLNRTMLKQAITRNKVEDVTRNKKQETLIVEDVNFVCKQVQLWVKST